MAAQEQSNLVALAWRRSLTRDRPDRYKHSLTNDLREGRRWQPRSSRTWWQRWRRSPIPGGSARTCGIAWWTSWSSASAACCAAATTSSRSRNSAAPKEDFFRRFLELPRGIPSHDTFRRVFQAVCPQALQRCLIEWLQGLRQTARPAAADGAVVAIDGKTLRRTFDRARGLGALHLVSAWATANGITLGQVAVDGKSNEITAIPQLIELLDLKGLRRDHRRGRLPEGNRREHRGQRGRLRAGAEGKPTDAV